MKLLTQKTRVYSGYSVKNKTWNLYDLNTNYCLFYGSINQLESWLSDNFNTIQCINKG